MIGKFLAGFLLVLFALIPTVVYYFSVVSLGSPVGNVDTAAVIGSYIGLALLGGVFCSIGIFASAITSNQIVAFILAAFFCFIFYSGLESLSALPVFGSSTLLIKQFGILYHYESISKGLIDSRDLIYFLSVTSLMLHLTKLKVSQHN